MNSPRRHRGRRVDILSLSGGADKLKNLSLFETIDIFHAEDGLRDSHSALSIPGGKTLFCPVAVSRPDKRKKPLCPLCLCGEDDLPFSEGAP